jgi:hypothetical protein
MGLPIRSRQPAARDASKRARQGGWCGHSPFRPLNLLSAELRSSGKPSDPSAPRCGTGEPADPALGGPRLSARASGPSSGRKRE